MNNFFKKNDDINNDENNNSDGGDNINNKSSNLIDMDEIESLIKMDKKTEDSNSNTEDTTSNESGRNTSKKSSQRENGQSEKSKQHRAKMRRAKLRRRRLTITAILILLIFLIVKLISLISGGSKEASNIPSLATWYYGQMLREQKGDFSSSITAPKTAYDKLMLPFSKATGIDKKIMPGTNHLVSASSYAYDTKKIRQYIRGEVEYTGGEKLVFLTFDDGPNTTITPKILNILNDNDVHATFFTVGKNITEGNYSVLRQTLMNGNSIAMHSFSHEYDLLYPDKTANTEKIIEEAQLTSGRLSKVFGDDFKSTVWRYPGGHLSWQGLNDADSKLQEMGIEWIDWNSLSGDSEKKSVRPTTTEEEVDYIIKSLNQNLHSDVAVVLMHDASNKQLTVDSLQQVINYFKENNYKFCILK